MSTARAAWSFGYAGARLAQALAAATASPVPSLSEAVRRGRLAFSLPITRALMLAGPAMAPSLNAAATKDPAASERLLVRLVPSFGAGEAVLGSPAPGEEACVRRVPVRSGGVGGDSFGPVFKDYGDHKGVAAGSGASAAGAGHGAAVHSGGSAAGSPLLLRLATALLSVATSAPRISNGDVVAFVPPYAAAKLRSGAPIDSSSDVLVRRVAASPGEELVSDDPADPSYVLRANECWVLADNEELEVKDALDSRTFGPLPCENVIGRVIYQASSLTEHGPVDNSKEAGKADQPVLDAELDVEKLIHSKGIW